MTATAITGRCTACGAPTEPDLPQLATTFARLVRPDLCAACNGLAGGSSAEADDSQAEAARREAQLARTIPPEMARTSISHPGFNAPLWLRVEQWQPQDRLWLGIVGPPGTSKTRCAALIARRLILEHGTAVLWSTGTAFQEAVEALDDRKTAPKARAYLEACRTAPVLCLDDISKLLWSRTLEARLFSVVDHRKTHDQAVVWTSNSTLREIGQSGLLTREFGVPLLSRINEITQVQAA